MTTTFYIIAFVCGIILSAVSFAIGHAQGKKDGYAEHSDYCRIRCAIRRGGAR